MCLPFYQRSIEPCQDELPLYGWLLPSFLRRRETGGIGRWLFCSRSTRTNYPVCGSAMDQRPTPLSKRRLLTVSNEKATIILFGILANEIGPHQPAGISFSRGFICYLSVAFELDKPQYEVFNASILFNDSINLKIQLAITYWVQVGFSCLDKVDLPTKNEKSKFQSKRVSGS